MITAFIDESGDLGSHEKGSAYFVICVVLTKEPELVRRIVRKVRDTLGKKKAPELKWHNSDENVRKKTLNLLAGLLIDVHIIIVKKSTLDTIELLYEEMVSSILHHSIFDDKKITLIFDERSKNKQLRERFNKFIIERMSASHPRIQVHCQHQSSTNDRGLQAADMIAGAALRKYEYDDPSFLNIMNAKIGSEKFFKKGRNQA